MGEGLQVWGRGAGRPGGWALMRTTEEQRWSGVDLSWGQRGACRNYPYFWWEAETGPESRMAKSICWSECPVREQCLQAALALEAAGMRDWARQGIWGGLSAYYRRMIARGEKPPPSQMPVDGRYAKMRKHSEGDDDD